MSDLIFSLRHRRHILRWNALTWVARHLPAQLRQAVVVDAAVRATTPPMIGPNDYAGPDGLDYRRLYEAAAFPLRPVMRRDEHPAVTADATGGRWEPTDAER